MNNYADSMLAPNFSILLNGEKIKDKVAERICEITVEDGYNEPCMFTIELNGAADLLDEGTFLIGQEVDIKLGYADNLTEMVSGEITAFNAEFSSRMPSNLLVFGFHKMHRLRAGKKTRSFLKMTDSQIASNIIRESGLTIQADATADEHEYILQNDQSDLEFLSERARRIHYELLPNGKNIAFRKALNENLKRSTLKWGEDVLNLQAHASVKNQISELTIKGWDPAKQEAVIGQAGSSEKIRDMKGALTGADCVKKMLGSSMITLVDNSIRSVKEAEEMAKIKLNEIALDFINGEGSCIGRPELRAGCIAVMEGFGDRLSGEYYVTSTRHSLGEQGYITYFKIKRNSY